VGGSSAEGGGVGDAFTHPVALNKLALFLVEVHRQNGKWVGATKARPLILLVSLSLSFLLSL